MDHQDDRLTLDEWAAQFEREGMHPDEALAAAHVAAGLMPQGDVVEIAVGAEDDDETPPASTAPRP
ncbi:MAG: hypothetical protein LCH53_13565 [Bacteroidetes bacterium]|nr:hypothetical protein [Bacteroidota bacterium]